MTEEAYYAMVREFLLLTWTGQKNEGYEIWRDHAGMSHVIQSPDGIPFDERREVLERKAASMMIDLPPISDCH